jgi:hypothetical protein
LPAVPPAAIVAPAASLASGTPDPIFATIEVHRQGLAATNRLFQEHYRLEATLPKELRQTGFTSNGEEIVETDAPEWIGSERALAAASDAEAES